MISDTKSSILNSSSNPLVTTLAEQPSSLSNITTTTPSPVAKTNLPPTPESSGQKPPSTLTHDRRDAVRKKLDL